MNATPFSTIFPGVTTECCVNLAVNDAGDALRPVTPPAELSTPPGYRPIALLDNRGTYLMACRNNIRVVESSVSQSVTRTLDSEPLCVVPGPSASTIVVMTRTRAYCFTRMALAPYGSEELTLPCVRAQVEAPVSAEMPSVVLSAAYGHGDSISPADTARLTAAARQLYEDLDSNVRGAGCYWQPVMVRVRALDASRRVLFESEPQLFTNPQSAEWGGQIALTAASDGRTTNVLDLQVPAFSLHIHASESAVSNGIVSSYELLVSPALHHCDITLQPSVATPRRAGTQTLCTVTFRPGVLDSPAPATRPLQLISLMARLLWLETSLVEIPCARLVASQSEKLPPLVAESVEASIKLVKKALAKTVSPAADGEYLLMPPHSFTASTVAVGADTVLWGGIEVTRFAGWGVEHFADSVTDAAWQGAVEVAFADGSTVVRTSSGSRDAPDTFGPVLSYPSPDAVSMSLCVSVAGQSLRKATFPLVRDPSAMRAVYVSPTMRPFSLPAADGNYDIPQATASPVPFHDTLLLCSSSAPLLPLASARVVEGDVKALAEAPFGQSSWDFGRVRYYVFTSRGIYLLSASSTRRAMSMSLIDNRIVNSRYAVTHTERGLAAIASGDIVLLSGSKAKRIDRGGLDGARALAWVHDSHELWCLCPDSTEVLCFDRDMSRYTIPMAFEEAVEAGTLIERNSGRCYLPGHGGDCDSVSVKWQATLGPYAFRCFGLRSLSLHIAGTFRDMKIALSRCSLLDNAPMPELEMLVDGTVRSPILRGVFIPPHLRLRLTLEGNASPDSLFYKTELSDVCRL